MPTRTGDMICILFGCSVPVLIRNVEDHHMFIGDCYIHGLMFGETIGLLKRGEVVQEEFHLH